MIIRVYKIGNNVAIEENSVVSLLIPCRSFRVEPEDTYVCLSDNETARNIIVLYTDVRDQSGAAIGNKQAVINYLAPFVGFSAASGTAAAWGGITGNILLQNDLQLALQAKADKELYYTLANKYLTTSSVSSDVGLNVSLTSGKLYKLSLFGAYQTTSQTVGIKLGFIAPSGTYLVNGCMTALTSIGTTSTEHQCTIHTINNSSLTVGSFLLTTGVGGGQSGVNVPHFVGGEILINCITNGQIRLQLASEINGVAVQLNAGYTIILKQLN